MSAGMPRNRAAATAGRDAEDDALRAARARRTAWLLGLLALAFYVGFMVYTALGGPR
jgi:hypothetical protein